MKHIQQAYLVPAQLTDPDKLILSAKKNLAQGIKRGNGYDTIRSGWEDIEINVAPINVDRSLRIMNTIVKCLKDRGFSFDTQERYSYAVTDGCKFRISCRDKLVKKLIKEKHWERMDFCSTGILSFKVNINGLDIEWKDGKVKLEDQVPNIFERLDSEIKKAQERSLELKIYWAKQREQEKILRI